MPNRTIFDLVTVFDLYGLPDYRTKILNSTKEFFLKDCLEDEKKTFPKAVAKKGFQMNLVR